MNFIKRILHSYTYAKFRAKKSGNHEYIIEYFRKNDIKIGNDCHIYTRITTPESYLISIGNNVTIATGARLITHDNSICKVVPDLTDFFGKIKIGNNCFIGAYSIILPGVTIGDNSIVAAGSIVTKSVQPNSIVAGNPARKISTTEDLAVKAKMYGVNVSGLSFNEKKEFVLKNKLLSR